jgi:hypothetical protein
MKIDISKLSKYDLDNAKAGDKVIVGYIEYSELWSFEETIVKSVSLKRGYITLSNGDKYRKDGRRMCVGKWDFAYRDTFFSDSKENIKIINSYLISKNEANKIIKWLCELEKQGFKMLYDLPEDKINILYKTMTEIFKVSEND